MGFCSLFYPFQNSPWVNRPSTGSRDYKKFSVTFLPLTSQYSSSQDNQQFGKDFSQQFLQNLHSFTQQKESKSVASECFSLLDFKAMLKIYPRTMQSHEKPFTGTPVGFPLELHHIYPFSPLVGLAFPNSHKAQALPSPQKGKIKTLPKTKNS